MPVTVRSTDGLVRALQDLAVRLADQCADGLVTTAQNNASRRTGNLADSITNEGAVLAGDNVRAHVVVEAEYGRYQDEGTGIYGPEGQVITPKHGNVLVFDWPAAGGIVFATYVRGSEPTRFWTKAIEAWPQIVSRINAGGGA